LLGHEIKRIEKKAIKDDSDINLPQAHDYPKTRKALLIFTGLIPFAYLASLPYLSKLKYAYSLQSFSEEMGKELIDISWFLQTPAATGAFSGSLFFGMIFQWDVL